MPLWYSKIRSYTRTTSPGNSFFPPGARLPSSMWYRTVSSVAFFTRQYTTNHGACWLRKPLHCDFPRYIVKPEYSKKLGEWKWLVAVRPYRSFAWNIFFFFSNRAKDFSLRALRFRDLKYTRKIFIGEDDEKFPFRRILSGEPYRNL